MQRMTWEEICQCKDYRGRWVALDGCCYDHQTGRAVEGAVVDVDTDLAELCGRMQDADRTNCAIMFATEQASVA